MISSPAVVDRFAAGIEALAPFLADARGRANAWGMRIQICISDPDAPYLHVENAPESGHGRMVAAALEQQQFPAIDALAQILRDLRGPRCGLGLTIDIDHDAPHPLFTPILRDGALEPVTYASCHITRGAVIPLDGAEAVRRAAAILDATASAGCALPARPDGDETWIGSVFVEAAPSTGVSVSASALAKDEHDFLSRMLKHAIVTAHLIEQDVPAVRITKLRPPGSSWLPADEAHAKALHHINQAPVGTPLHTIHLLPPE